MKISPEPHMTESPYRSPRSPRVHPSAYSDKKPSPVISPQEVTIGERPVEGLPGTIGAKHMGIKLGDTWYEVTGEGIQQIGQPQQFHQGATPTKPFVKQITLGDTPIPPEQFKEWIGAWQKKHGTYNAWDNNCQQFVIDMAKKAGFIPPVRNQAEPVVKLFSPLLPKSPPTPVPITPPSSMDEVAKQARELRKSVEKAREILRETEELRTPKVLITFTCYHMSRSERDRLVKEASAKWTNREEYEKARKAREELYDKYVEEQLKEHQKEMSEAMRDLQKVPRLLEKNDRTLKRVDRGLSLLGILPEVYLFFSRTTT